MSEIPGFGYALWQYFLGWEEDEKESLQHLGKEEKHSILDTSLQVPIPFSSLAAKTTLVDGEMDGVHQGLWS